MSTILRKILAAPLTAGFLVFSMVSALFTPMSSAEAIGIGNCTSTTTGTLVATVTQSGSTCLVTFTSGTGTWTLPAGTYSVSYLVVGGGVTKARLKGGHH